MITPSAGCVAPGIGYRWVIVGCCVLAYATTHLMRWSYTGLAAYISADLHLNKAALGLLGGAFFFPYALAQVPWGRLTDRCGGRYVIALGVLGAAVLLVGFADARTLGEAAAWRAGLGVLAACCFVPIAGVLARWFAPRERGLANGAYHGLGGGVGEAAAFLLLPVIGVLVLGRAAPAGPDWRGASVVMAGLVAAVGLVSLGLLRSAPEPGAVGEAVGGRRENVAAGPSGPLTRDPVLWLLGLYFAGGIVALRLMPGWVTIYATDLYRTRWGYGLDEAVLAGGGVGVWYAAGRVAGSPAIGWLSDRLLAGGVSRVALAAGGQAVSLAGFAALALPLPAPWLLAPLALAIGVALNTFPLINAVAAERWGARRAAESLGWINMVGQLAGAVALSASGYLGIALASRPGDPPGDPIDEYAGIWALGLASCAVGAASGWLASRLLRRGG